MISGQQQGTKSGQGQSVFLKKHLDLEKKEYMHHETINWNEDVGPEFKVNRKTLNNIS